MHVTPVLFQNPETTLLNTGFLFWYVDEKVGEIQESNNQNNYNKTDGIAVDQLS
jgi:hypothetical protein